MATRFLVRRPFSSSAALDSRAASSSSVPVSSTVRAGARFLRRASAEMTELRYVALVEREKRCSSCARACFEASWWRSELGRMPGV